jgi:hypothetical protein
LNGKTRRFGDDKQVRKAAECGDDVFGNPSLKKILPGIL